MYIFEINYFLVHLRPKRCLLRPLNALLVFFIRLIRVLFIATKQLLFGIGLSCMNGIFMQQLHCIYRGFFTLDLHKFTKMYSYEFQMQMSLNAQATFELREEAKQALNLRWVCSARTNFNKTIAARMSNSAVALHGSRASHYCTDRSQFPVTVESQKNICFPFRIHRSYGEGITNIGAFVDSKKYFVLQRNANFCCYSATLDRENSS